MRGVLADIKMVAQARALVSIWNSETWRDLWNEPGLAVETFASLGLPLDASDALIWRTCQREGVVLMTDNRNDDGPDSLEATIRSENQPGSLPVFTIADTDRIFRDRLYAERVAERLLDYLMLIDEIRGTGRLYVP